MSKGLIKLKEVNQISNRTIKCQKGVTKCQRGQSCFKEDNQVSKRIMDHQRG